MLTERTWGMLKLSTRTPFASVVFSPYNRFLLDREQWTVERGSATVDC